MIKQWWNSFKIAFSMYSKIPMPKADWNKENISYAMCFFPWIGIVCGVLTLAVWEAKTWAGQADIQAADWTFTVFLVLVPLLVTGGIHMDGFLDTQDAKNSYQPKEKKLEILSDPHTGAFAVLSCAVYLLLYSGIYASLTADSVKVIAVSFLLSRTLSGLSVLCFPKAKQDGLAATFSGYAAKRTVKRVLVVYAVLISALLFFVGGVTGAAVVLTAFAVFAAYYRMATDKFGGMTGDLAGYFLQMCEIAMALAAVAADLLLKAL